MADHSYSSDRVRHRWKDHCYFSFAKKTPKVVLEKSGIPQPEFLARSLDHTYVKLSPVAVALSCDQDEQCGADPRPSVMVWAALPAVVGQDHSYGCGGFCTTPPNSAESSLIVWANTPQSSTDLDYSGVALYAVDNTGGERFGEAGVVGGSTEEVTQGKVLKQGIYLQRVMEGLQTSHHDHTYLMYKTWHNDHTYMHHDDVYIAS
ncbi:hypothetical protein LSAT2_006532 [Lamellibrachia satsuma]|nr:hypothetical protein LSAT2_006532 [Lamellibrachia satsuma]